VRSERSPVAVARGPPPGDDDDRRDRRGHGLHGRARVGGPCPSPIASSPRYQVGQLTVIGATAGKV
jgi:hypothetical protein